VKRSDLFFSVPRIISHLSRSTTLLPGTLILTGTPSGVAGWNTPPEWLQENDEFSVEITPHIGTVTTIFKNVSRCEHTKQESPASKTLANTEKDDSANYE